RAHGQPTHGAARLAQRVTHLERRCIAWGGAHIFIVVFRRARSSKLNWLAWLNATPASTSPAPTSTGSVSASPNHTCATASAETGLRSATGATTTAGRPRSAKL